MNLSTLCNPAYLNQWYLFLKMKLTSWANSCPIIQGGGLVFKRKENPPFYPYQMQLVMAKNKVKVVPLKRKGLKRPVRNYCAYSMYKVRSQDQLVASVRHTLDERERKEKERGNGFLIFVKTKVGQLSVWLILQDSTSYNDKCVNQNACILNHFPSL